jgi:hypothetical protein
MFNAVLVKGIISQVAGMSSAYIVKNVIRSHVHPETTVQTAQMYIGSFAIGGYVSKRIMQDTSETLDQIEAIYNRLQEHKNTAE